MSDGAVRNTFNALRIMAPVEPDERSAVQFLRSEAKTALPTDPFGYSNAGEFDAIDEAVSLLFYTETTDEQVIFDPENDAALLSLFVSPFQFQNQRLLSVLEALVDRAYYLCKPHPTPEPVLALVRDELSLQTDNLLAFVYRRDSARSSPVANRRQAPFRNTLNGLESAQSRSPQLILFARYSHEPQLSVSVVWQQAVRPNASVGVVVFEVVEVL